MSGLPSIPPAGLAFGTVIAGQSHLPLQVGDIEVVDEAAALASIANTQCDSDTKIRLLCAVLLKKHGEKMEAKREVDELKQENRELKGTIAELNDETKKNKLQITELKGENAELKHFAAQEKTFKELRDDTVKEIITFYPIYPLLFLAGIIHVDRPFITRGKLRFSGGCLAMALGILRLALNDFNKRQAFVRNAMERILAENHRMTSAEARHIAESEWYRNQAEEDQKLGIDRSIGDWG